MTQIGTHLAQIFSKKQPTSTSVHGACVFDMDSTLFCVSSRTEKILKDFASSHIPRSQAMTEILPVLKEIELNPSDWGILSALRRHRIEISRSDFEQIRAFWAQHFFSNEYLKYDLLYDQSNEFATLCKEVGYKVLYLTGRDHDSMRSGSLDQLKAWNFPLEKEEDLIMRPKKFEKDEDFKVQILSDLKNQYEPIYFFENEPVIINRVLNAKLDVNVIYMDSTHSGREQIPDSVERIFPESYKKILNHFNKTKDREIK